MTDDDIEFCITKEEEGERLDKILTKRFSSLGYSRSYFQYLIDANLVLLGGEPVKKRVKPSFGDEIEVSFTATPEVELIAENIPLTILFEDDHLIIINKPSGMVVHPATGHWSGTFVNALLYHCKSLHPDGSLRPGIVHRLDKDTSGILVAAKTLEAQQKMVALFASRSVYKEYLAICIGRPPDGEITGAIGRHPVHRKQMAIVENGRAALSTFQTLRWNEKLSLVKVIISTGRTHQIRVHLKSTGHPVLGDPVYGSVSTNHDFKVERPLLHASVLRFVHPINGELITIEAPIPEDFQAWIKKI